MDKRVIVAAFLGFIFIVFLIVFAIRVFLGLVSSNIRPSPRPVASPALSPLPVVERAPQTITSQAPVSDKDTKEFLIENEGVDYTVKEMKVNTYDRVKVTFRVNRGRHTWTIKQFNVFTRELGPGERETVEFVADRPGIYEYYCSVGDHKNLGMSGRLVVK